MGLKTFLGGITNTTLHSESDGTLIVEEKQDAEPILEINKALRNERFDARSPEGFGEVVANVPTVVYLDECRKRRVQPYSKEGDTVMALILRDPQYAHFLAAPKQRDPHIIIRGHR